MRPPSFVTSGEYDDAKRPTSCSSARRQCRQRCPAPQAGWQELGVHPTPRVRQGDHALLKLRIFDRDADELGAGVFAQVLCRPLRQAQLATELALRAMRAVEQRLVLGAVVDPVGLPPLLRL
jgi:hypothetical protein